MITCTTAGAEAEHIAEILRGAHLRDGLGWDEMAVLVRSGRATIPGLTRALMAAGVPVEVAGDEIPLAADPAVRPLLLGLQIASREGSVTTDEAQGLLTSPLGGLDSMAVRRLGRSLREAERADLGGTALPRPSAELIALSLTDPDQLAECAPGPEVDGDAPAGRSARSMPARSPGAEERGGGAVAALVRHRLAGAAAGRLRPRRRGGAPVQP